MPPLTQRDGGATFDNVNTRDGGGNWRHNRNSQNSGGNWQTKCNDWNFDLNQANWRESDRNSCPLNGGGHNLGGISFNASSRRDNLHNRSTRQERSGNDQEYQDFISWRSHHSTRGPIGIEWITVTPQKGSAPQNADLLCLMGMVTGRSRWEGKLNILNVLDV